MSWPQITIAALTVANLGYILAKDGKPRTGEYSFFVTAIATAIQMWILYMGGFWK